MKVVLIFLALVLSLAAALPLEGSTDGSREDRAKKESAKLRLASGSSSPILDTIRIYPGAMEKKLYTDAAFDYLGRSVGRKENITLGSNPNGTVLVLTPKAHAEAGAGGTAIAKPLSIAILNSKQDRVIFRPMVSAVAGPGGMAIAEPELIIRKRWEEEEASESPARKGSKQKTRIQLEHRQTDDDHHSEVVEASEVMISNSGDKSVAQAQPVGLASAGLGGVAVAGPQGIAIVGPGGLALARPIAVAIAGPGADNPLIFLKPEEEAPPAEEGGQQGGEPEVEEEDPQPTFYSPTYLFYYPLFNRFPVH